MIKPLLFLGLVAPHELLVTLILIQFIRPMVITLPVATGIKLSDPELNVIVISGDGDATAIGGNHFIHAAETEY